MKRCGNVKRNSVFALKRRISNVKACNKRKAMENQTFAMALLFLSFRYFAQSLLVFSALSP